MPLEVCRPKKILVAQEYATLNILLQGGKCLVTCAYMFRHWKLSLSILYHTLVLCATPHIVNSIVGVVFFLVCVKRFTYTYKNKIFMHFAVRL